jgi:hypothetical protein
MTETKYQEIFIEELSKRHPDWVIVPFLELKYEIGKYYKGKVLGMPDCVLDVVVFDNKNNFHLFELKTLANSEIWNGKIFGQLMLYDFLFSTEPWNELVGRFAMANKGPNSKIKGDIGRILIHLANYGRGEIALQNDKKAKFKTWNIVLCGGNGTEVIEQNPFIRSFLTMAQSYFNRNIPELYIHHFYKKNKEWFDDLLHYNDAIEWLEK